MQRMEAFAMKTIEIRLDGVSGLAKNVPRLFLFLMDIMGDEESMVPDALDRKYPNAPKDRR